MSSLLRRLSFTTRLIAAAFSIAVALIIVDYLTLLDLPEHVAGDSVEVALREDTQSFNMALTQEREELSTALETFIETPDAARTIKTEDPGAVEQLLSENDLDDVKVAFVNRGSVDQVELGAVSVSRALGGLQSKRIAVFYREITDAVLDRAAADAGDRVAFAVERDGEYIARSDAYDRSISPSEVNVGAERDASSTTTLKIDDQDRHVFSRRLSQNSAYQVSALASPDLEQDALAATRGDIRNAIFEMTAATFTGFLLIAFFTSRMVRSFASRVRELAHGDYSRRMPVHGRDGFADLASSVNVLSGELEQRMSDLHASAAAFRRTLETLDEGICTWNEQGEVAYWNRGAEQLTGVARERATIEDPLVAFLAAERTPGTRRVTLPVRRSGAGGLVVDLVVTDMPGGGVLQTFRDTSMADVLQRTQRDFMATAAHQLRTPITTILGFADTLSNPELELSDRQREEFLGIVRDQSHQLQQIADAFFTNHQLATERVEVSLGPVALVQAVADAVERARHTAGEHPDEPVLDIEIDVANDLVVMADRRALVGVISVLLDNAIKYGRQPIALVAERTGGTIALLVHDEGAGIDPYHQTRVFDPFYRIDVDMRSGVGGAGLGLFSARKLVEAMRGMIRVRSDGGGGTTFVVELPAAPAKRDADDDDAGGANLRLVV